MTNPDAVNTPNGLNNYISPSVSRDGQQTNTNLASTSFSQSYLPNPIGQKIKQVLTLPGDTNHGVKVLLENGEHAFINNNPGVGQTIKEQPLAYGSSGIVDSWISSHIPTIQINQNIGISSNSLSPTNQTNEETHAQKSAVIASTNISTRPKANDITTQPSIVANTATNFQPRISTPILANPYEARSKSKQLTVEPTPGMLAADENLNKKLNNIFSKSGSSTAKANDTTSNGVTNIGASDPLKGELNPASGSMLNSLNNLGSKDIKGL